jgi:hypothetical protein
MRDDDVRGHIDDLVALEQRLRADEVGRGLSDEEREQLRATEVELDRLWDLLRQRRARREAGLDPDEATERPADTVEGYLQ